VKANPSKITNRIAFALYFLCILAAPLAVLRAATIAVTNTADSGPGTLRQAVSGATNGDTIVFSLPTPSKITLTSGEIAFNRSINILGPGPTNLLVDGNASGWRIFDIFNHSTNADIAVIVTIAGLTVTNAAAQNIEGAAIYNQSTTLTVSNCIFSGNSNTTFGGAIANVGMYFGNGAGPSQLYLIDSIFENNSAVNSSGGAVFNEASGGFQGRPTRATVTATNCVFRGNFAGSGGAIANGGGTSIVHVANCTLTGNTANNAGGAIDNGFVVTGAFGTGISTMQLDVSGSTLSGNTAIYGGGGGSYGGATFNSGIMAVLNTTFAGNVATNGGAIYSALAVAITNSTFSSNVATKEGGAVDNGYNTSCLVLNSTFKGDYAPALGSGIHNYGDNLQIGGTILNETGTASIYDSNLPGFGVISLGYNLNSDDGGGYLTNATDQINTNPLLGPLQDNGGPTFTHAPLPGSPAIDKGINFSGSATDQRGFPRTFDKAAIPNAAGGDGTDIGAVESQSYTVVNTNDSGAGSLRQAIADSNAQPGTNNIDFAPSAYGTILLTSGELLITNNVFIAGPGATYEAVDGNASSRVFHINTNSVVTIASLTITNGLGAGNGGGIFNDHATLSVSNSVVSGNSGGGIFNGIFGAGNSTLNIFNSILSSNSVVGGGGGIYNNAYGGTASVQIVNSTLSGNKATANTGGGGIHSACGSGGNAIVQIVNSAIIRNAANAYPSPSGPGGGIYIRSFGPGNASLTVTNSAITGNLSYVAGGGIAIFCQVPGSTATVAVVSSTLSSNSTPVGGGAIYSTSYDSSSGHGGKISLQVANCTISGNSAGAGTAISNDGHNTGGGITRILNCTVSSNFNSSPFGTADGIDNGGNSKLEIGSTVLNNLGTNLGGFSTMITSLGYNLSSDNGAGFLTNSTDQLYTDPMLGPLQDNGGPTFTQALLPGSPARDNGTNFSGSATDQRGFKRTLGGGDTDVGAVQSQDMSLRLIKAGVVSNQFGFNLVGAFTTVVVEGSTNVTGGHWTALATNTLGDAPLRFNDPSGPTLPKRFYRAQLQ
jgi:predicted outer membrane repeat protein